MTAVRSNLTLLMVGGVILLGGTMKNFKVIGTTSFQIPINDTPELTTDEKADIQSLIIDYLSNKNKFVYDGSFRRESYAYPKSVSSLSSQNVSLISVIPVCIVALLEFSNNLLFLILLENVPLN